MEKYKELNYKFLSINKQRGIIDILVYISILTSSFDILFNINVAGFSVRLTQLCAIILFFVFLLRVINVNKVIIPVYFKYLFFYFLLNTVFVFNSIHLKNSIGYELWLLLNVSQLFVYVNLFNDKDSVCKLLKVYFSSFFVLALIGIIQHIVLQVGLGKLLLLRYDQDRICGFSYEPSYYSTYLLPGWCAILYFMEKGNYVLFPKKTLVLYFISISLAMLFSYSRMGLVVAFAYVVFRIITIIFFTRINKGCIVIKKKNITWLILLFATIFMIIIYLLYLYKYDYEYFRNRLQGLGLFGTAKHSSETRMESLYDTLEIFYKSPFLGCSLGDIDGRIAQGKGLIYRGETGLSMSIIAEQFAATGIIGGICFVVYLFRMVFLYKKICKNSCYAETLKGICLGLIFQIIILNMNQNVLRQYFWINIAIILVIYNFENIKIKKENIDYKVNYNK